MVSLLSYSCSCLSPLKGSFDSIFFDLSSRDDPRFPTVRGVLRRGMTVEGLKQFIAAQVHFKQNTLVCAN